MAVLSHAVALVALLSIAPSEAFSSTAGSPVRLLQRGRAAPRPAMAAVALAV